MNTVLYCAFYLAGIPTVSDDSEYKIPSTSQWIRMSVAWMALGPNTEASSHTCGNQFVLRLFKDRISSK